MGVQKIIQDNPDVFNIDKNKNHSEKEAIKIVASMECKGNKIQIENFEIRQAYTTICNLLSLGFRESAMDLATKLIPRAEWYQQYRIAQDLCDKLISHHYQYGSIENVRKFKSLHDKFTIVLTCEHESKLLFGEAIYNYQHMISIDVESLMRPLEAIKEKLSVDSLWYHYYYFQCKTLMYTGKELEQLFIEAIEYFENLYFNHTNFISFFTDSLIRFYLENNELEKGLLLVESQKSKFDVGTIRWFRNSLSYVNILLQMNNPRCIEICKMVIGHPKYQELPEDKKIEWDAANKASIKIMQNSN